MTGRTSAKRAISEKVAALRRKSDTGRMERWLDRQDELLLAMKAEGKQPTITESIRLFDNQDLCMLLQISKRTLQRYRSVGALPYKTLGKKTYYSEEDVLTFLSNHIKDFKKEDIAFYKARIHNFFHK